MSRNFMVFLSQFCTLIKHKKIASTNDCIPRSRVCNVLLDGNDCCNDCKNSCDKCKKKSVNSGLSISKYWVDRLKKTCLVTLFINDLLIE